MDKIIVLVTSAQPSANPRLVKEVLALVGAGYTVKVIYCPLSPWADKFDKELFSQYPSVEWMKVGYHPKNDKFKYTLSRLRQKFFQFVYRLFGNIFNASIKSIVLFSQELVDETKKYKADLYIGHNLGALSAIVNAAYKYNSKSVFDFEDYHRGEFNKCSLSAKKVIAIENRYIPLVDSLTASSPEITEAYKSIFSNKNIVTILNVFPLQYAANKLSEMTSLPLKLFWFSQSIGVNRGLETVINAMGKLEKGNVQLTLLGNCTSEMKLYFVSLASRAQLDQNQLVFLDPVDEKEIVSIASKNHIGLACEIPHIPNRELCLTNKIFMYLLAGNAIVMTNTKAQSEFYNQYTNIGFIYNHNDSDQLAQILNFYLSNSEILKNHRDASLNLAVEKLNWEEESNKFLNNVESLLN